MAAAAKHLFADLRHGHQGRRTSESKKQAKNAEDDPTFQRNKEDEKHFIAQWEVGSHKKPLSPTEVAKDPIQKQVGLSSKCLRIEDFKLLKTLGTGTVSSSPRSSKLLIVSRNICASMVGQACATPRWRREDSLCVESSAKDGQCVERREFICDLLILILLSSVIKLKQVEHVSAPLHPP